MSVKDVSADTPHATFDLRTHRLHLRPPTLTDATELWPLVSDARLTTYLAWAPHKSIDETHLMLESLIHAQKSGTGYHWIILDRDKVIGIVSLIDVKRQHRSWTLNRAELAYWIGYPYQGSGFATEAAKAVVDFGFHKLNLHKIRVYHAEDNAASGRTVEKLDFRLVGIERDAFCKDTVWHHLRHFEMLQSDIDGS